VRQAPRTPAEPQFEAQAGSCRPALRQPDGWIALRLADGAALVDVAREAGAAPAEVLARARRFVHELDPHGAAQVEPEWRDHMADFVLGVQSEDEAALARAHAARFDRAALWAQAVRERLREPGARPVMPPPASANGAVPKLAEDVVITGTGPGAPFVVFSPSTGRYLRIKPQQCAVLRSLDGRRSLDQVEAAWAGHVPDGLVRALVARFDELGLLEREDAPPAAEQPHRLQLRDITSIRFTLANPDALLDRALPAIRRLGSVPALVLAAFVAVVGLVCLVATVHVETLAAGRIADPLVLGTVVPALVAAVILHELGHAAAVKYFGGTVTRMGVMLFYVAPALFCDTSDAWRFRHRWQRAVVASAGLGVQVTLAGVAGLLLLLPLGPGGQAWLALFGVVAFSMAALNLLPFVKLDGYWILASLVDVPNLRAKAVARVRALAGRVAFGTPVTPSRVSHPVLLALFGLACVVCGPLLAAAAVLGYERPLLGLGTPGAVVWLTLATALLVLLGVKLAALARVVRAGASRGRARAAVVALAGCAVAAAGLAFIRVDLVYHGTLDRGVAHVAHARPGAPVRVVHASLLGTRTVAWGRLGARVGRDRYRLVLGRQAGGSLEVDGGRASTATWLYVSYVRPLVSVFGL
jgi:putative peptide zinc metalloprotease protein